MTRSTAQGLSPTSFERRSGEQPATGMLAYGVDRYRLSWEYTPRRADRRTPRPVDPSGVAEDDQHPASVCRPHVDSEPPRPEDLPLKNHQERGGKYGPPARGVRAWGPSTQAGGVCVSGR